MATQERLGALNYRDYRLFIAGQLVSFSGTWMHSTAQGWLVYTLTRSPLYLGLVAAAQSLPILLFSLMGGVIADRSEKRTLLFLTQGLSIVPVLMLGALTSLGMIQVWHIMALGFALGTINALDIPTRQSYLIAMVERESLTSAIALNSAMFNGARIIGPMLAGFVIAAWGVAVCFYINAVSFLAVLVALAFIRARGLPTPHGKGSMRTGITEGLSFIWKHPGLRRPMLLVATFSLFGLPFVAMMPAFAEDVLGVGVKGLGYLMGASGVGAFAGAMSIAFRGDLRNKDRVIAVASLVFPVALLVFALSRSFPLSMISLLIGGGAVLIFMTTANSAVQLRSPDGLRGRVMSVYTVMFLGFAPAGQAMIGLLAHYVGPQYAVAMAACVCAAVSLYVILKAGGGGDETAGA